MNRAYIFPLFFRYDLLMDISTRTFYEHDPYVTGIIVSSIDCIYLSHFFPLAIDPQDSRASHLHDKQNSILDFLMARIGSCYDYDRMDGHRLFVVGCMYRLKACSPGDRFGVDRYI
jgi:hypothetical protein